MTANKRCLSVGMLVMALTAAGQLVEAGQRDSQGRDRGGRDRGGRESQGQARERSGGSSERARRDDNAPAAQAPSQQPRETAPFGARRGNDGQERATTPQERPRDGSRYGNNDQRDAARDNRAGRDERADRGGRGQAVPRREGQVPRVFQPGPNDRDRNNRNDRRDGFRYEPYRDYGRYDDRYGAYGTRRLTPGPRSLRHYYGSGGSYSVYFGLGSGYLFGSPYYGRVYGYAAPRVYGARIYYGDVRLQVRPRNAAVYVDGYYAGVVDDFDGVFQRLTLEVGPHEIEVSAPGLEPQFYDVYVDPARTVTIRADLYPY